MGWIEEICYIVLYISLVLQNPANPVEEGEFDPVKQNIVLVYASWGTPNTMLRMKEKLEKAGFNVLIPNLGWMKGEKIDKFADRLQRFIEAREKRLLERHGGILSDLKNKTVLFGHSMGGLVILAAQRIDERLLEFQVITAGTPLKGSPLAYLVPWSEQGREMRPDSEWIKKLREHIKEHPRRLLQIQAESDELVPRDYSALEGYPTHITSFVGHAALIFKLDAEIFRGTFTQSP